MRACDGTGSDLAQEEGETIPEWGGKGDPQAGNYAGLPGKIYAKVLSELWTETSPTAAYWNQTTLVSDNRLAPFATDTSRYAFRAPGHQKVSVQVRLIYRRAFKELIEQRIGTPRISKWKRPRSRCSDFHAQATLRLKPPSTTSTSPVITCERARRGKPRRSPPR